jgi:hypothetical protein
MDAAGILLKLEDIRRLLHASCCCPLYVRCLDGGKGLIHIACLSGCPHDGRGRAGDQDGIEATMLGQVEH